MVHRGALSRERMQVWRNEEIKRVENHMGSRWDVLSLPSSRFSGRGRDWHHPCWVVYSEQWMYGRGCYEDTLL